MEGNYLNALELYIDSRSLTYSVLEAHEEYRDLVHGIVREAIYNEIRYADGVAFADDWDEYWYLLQGSMDGVGSTKTLLRYTTATDTDAINEAILDVLTTKRELVDVSAYIDDELESATADSRLEAYICYNDVCGIHLNTERPTQAPTSESEDEDDSGDDDNEELTGGGNGNGSTVTSEAWFWVLIVLGILSFFACGVAYAMRQQNKRDKAKRGDNLNLMKKLATLNSASIEMQKQQNETALTHKIWLGGDNDTTDMMTAGSDELEDGPPPSEGAGGVTGKMNAMLAAKLRAQRMGGMPPAALAMGGMGMGGMGMGMPMAGGMMGMPPMMGMNPMMMGRMGITPMMMAQYQNPHSVLGNINNYMVNPAMMAQLGMGMKMEEMAKLVAFQNADLKAAHGGAINPLLLNTAAKSGEAIEDDDSDKGASGGASGGAGDALAAGDLAPPPAMDVLLETSMPGEALADDDDDHHAEKAKDDRDVTHGDAAAAGGDAERAEGGLDGGGGETHGGLGGGGYEGESYL